MSRRDTIIIALLVNASLLALLFMLAINTDDDTIVDHPEMIKAIVDTRTSSPSMSKQSIPIIIDPHVNDEVDSFLKDLAAEETQQSILIDEENYIELAQEAPTLVKRPVINPAGVLEETHVEVTVKRGDALEKIARNNGTTIDAIKKANNLSTAKLSIGQVLRVPISKKVETVSTKPQIATVQPPKETEKKVVPATEIQYYTVKSGDNPWKIAKQFNVKFEELLKLNHLDEETARNLKIGDKVRVK